jgi:hypothetical protein
MIKFSGKGNVVVSKGTAPVKVKSNVANGSAKPVSMRKPSK